MAKFRVDTTLLTADTEMYTADNVPTLDYSLDAGLGLFQVDATGVSMVKGCGINVSHTEYILSASWVQLKTDRLFAAGKLELLLTGISIGVTKECHLHAACGSYSLIGIPVHIKTCRTIGVTGLGISLSGKNIDIVKECHLSVTNAEYNLSGVSIGIRANRGINASHGEFSVTTELVNFLKELHIPIVKAEYVIDGSSMWAGRTLSLSASTQEYNLGDNYARFSKAQLIQASKQEYNLSGNMAAFYKQVEVTTGHGIYLVEGNGINFQKNLAPVSPKSRMTVIKNFHIPPVSGIVSQNIDGYSQEFLVDKIILTLVSGTPTDIKIGWSLNTDEVAWLTDLSFMSPNIPLSLSLDQVPPQNIINVYMNLFSAVYTIDLILVRRIGAIYEGDTL
jgi:hypothetical protein